MRRVPPWLMLGAMTATSLCCPAAEWTWVRRAPLGLPDEPLVDVAFGRSRFIAGDPLARVWTSADGLIWSPIEGVRSDTVRFQNGRFFVALQSSADGLTWEPIRVSADSNPALSVRNATWLGDRFFAASYDFVAHEAVFGISVDGLEWRTSRGPARFEPQAVATDGARVVVTGDDLSQVASGAPAAVVIATDGTWSMHAIGERGFEYHDVAFGNGRFVAVGGGREISSGGLVLASADGRSWQLVATASQRLNHVVFSGGQFVAAGDNANILTSSDGMLWVRQRSGVEFGVAGGTALTALCAPPGGYLIAGNEAVLLRSANGRDWERIDAGPGAVTRGHFFQGEFWFSVQGDLLKTADGVVWRRDPVTPLRAEADFVSDLAFSGEAYVALRHSGRGFLRSTNGRDWSVTFPDARYYNAIAADDGVLVAVGDAGNIAVSRDHGVTWSARAEVSGIGFTGVVHGGGRFLVLSPTRTLVSRDGLTWMASPEPAPGMSPVRFPAQAVYFGQKFFGLGPEGIVQSADGFNWERVRLPTDLDLRRVYAPQAGERELFVVGEIGDAGALLSSSDGTTWQVSPLPDPMEHPSLTCGGDMLLLADAADAGLGRKTLYAGNRTPAARLANFSALGNVAELPLTLGFACGASSGQRLLLRAIAPGLERFGIRDFARDVALRLFDQNGRVAEPESSALLPWESRETVPQITVRVGGFPTAPTDVSRLARVRAGTYTVQVKTGAGGAGVALAEVYDAEQPPAGGDGLINISAGLRLERGAELAVGFVVAGPRSIALLARIAGPALQRLGVADAVPDPELLLQRADGLVLAANDDWNRSDQAAAIRVHGLLAGAFGFDDSGRDAAALLTLPPGAYTLRGRDHAGGGGQVVVEIYVLR